MQSLSSRLMSWLKIPGVHHDHPVQSIQRWCSHFPEKGIACSFRCMLLPNSCPPPPCQHEYVLACAELAMLCHTYVQGVQLQNISFNANAQIPWCRVCRKQLQHGWESTITVCRLLQLLHHAIAAAHADDTERLPRTQTMSVAMQSWRRCTRARPTLSRAPSQQRRRPRHRPLQPPMLTPTGSSGQETGLYFRTPASRRRGGRPARGAKCAWWMMASPG